MYKHTAGYFTFPENFLTARKLCLSKVWGSVEKLLLGKKTNYFRLKKNHWAQFWNILTPSHARNKAAHNNLFCLLFFLYSSVSTHQIFLIKSESVWDINFFFLLCLFINHHNILFIIDELSGTPNQTLQQFRALISPSSSTCRQRHTLSHFYHHPLARRCCLTPSIWQREDFHY